MTSLNQTASILGRGKGEIERMEKESAEKIKIEKEKSSIEKRKNLQERRKASWMDQRRKEEGHLHYLSTA